MDDALLLSNLAFWPRIAVERLAARSITTAEGAVQATATPDGRATLIEVTGLSDNALDLLLARTRRALPPEVRARLGPAPDAAVPVAPARP
ncbi:hypothetical protein [Muricoccus radiodurans]|uniref:hypothetical protein n=1 Tax=Muricoccus radiodurans TaxID=2231721 RepID=UPI003CF9A2F4